MAPKRDYYEILKLARDSTDDQIKRAFRRLAKQLHPDVNKSSDAEARFKEVGEAYAILSDPEKRGVYDRYGHEGLAGMGGTDFSGGFPFEDIFDQFFGGFGGVRHGGSARGQRRGADLRYSLGITFDEAMRGTVREIEITRAETCTRCQGSRAEPGTSPVRCATCSGTGEVRQVRQTFLGSMVNVSTCPACGGQGEEVSTPCRECRGAGQVEAPRRLSVKIPAGVDDGTQIRLSGEGENAGGRDGLAGNLYVVLAVEPHPYFRRQDDDVLLELEINVAQAALGAEVIIPTIDKEEPLRIPPGTQPGDVVRLRGRGVPHVRHGGRGDQVVIINVDVPTTLTTEQLELLTALQKTLPNGAKPREYKREHGFFDRLRDAFGI